MSLNKYLFNQPYLLLDASGFNTQVGIWKNGKWLIFLYSSNPPIHSIFKLTKQCLHHVNLRLNEIAGFFFCQGPGSRLGIRLCEIAIRGWQAISTKKYSLFSYNSFEIASEIIKSTTKNYYSSFIIITPLRQGLWHGVTYKKNSSLIYHNKIKKLEFNNSNSIFWILNSRKQQNSPPVKAKTVEYSLQQQAYYFKNSKFLRKVEKLEYFIKTKEEYKIWNGKRHF